MAFLFSPITAPGVSITIWSLVGFARFLEQKITRWKRQKFGFPRQLAGIIRLHAKRRAHHIRISDPQKPLILQKEVAIILPAHNEELVIVRTLKSLKKLVGKSQIYVASDGSSDKTAKLAKKEGCHVLEIFPNKGKAGAIKETIKHFKLAEKYQLIMFADADTAFDKNYLKVALPYFNDPKVAAFTGYGQTQWKKHLLPNSKMFFIAYRDRLYRILQFAIRYGQTWKYTNVSYIIPGFASIYRSSVLEKLKIAPQGLVIEDFNLTFDLRKKKLGLAVYDPKAIATAQDPDNFSDYFKQTMRWSVGFWQTVFRQGIWLSFFWTFLLIFVIEVGLNSLFFLSIPILALLIAAQSATTFVYPYIINLGKAVAGIYGIQDLLFGFFILDYVATVATAIWARRPLLLIYGLGFIFLRFVDAIIFFYSIQKALTIKSRGAWAPATRRQT